MSHIYLLDVIRCNKRLRLRTLYLTVAKTATGKPLFKASDGD